MSETGPTPRRGRAAPESAKDILGQLDTALGRVGRARGIAESAGFTQAAAALSEAEQGIEETMTRVETALHADLAAILRASGAMPAGRSNEE